MCKQPVDDLDSLVGLVDGHVDVEPEDQLAPRHVLELIDEVPVAVTRGDPLALEQAERVRAGRADAHAAIRRETDDVRPKLAQLDLDLLRRAADGRRDLQH